MNRKTGCLAIALFVCFFQVALATVNEASNESRRLILAHYMPWFECNASQNSWGWHWTMNAFHPDTEQNGKREIASRYYPLIGPYDSGDPAVLEYHVLLMKTAGIDGVIIDWYGLKKFRDYPLLHRNTERLIKVLQQYGMQFAICYEDQTIGALIEAKQIVAAERVKHAQSELKWIAEHWFGLANYVRIDGKPVLLSFGQTGLSDSEWAESLSELKQPVAYFSQHHRRKAAVGAFDWPVPQSGMAAQERFENEAKVWPQSISVAFPRFEDIYAQAKVHASWGLIEDNAGRTFQSSMDIAFQSKSKIVQIATWNDWGEGTNVEPSVEFGYRDLQVIQKMRRVHIDRAFAPQAKDLELPFLLWKMRSQSGGTKTNEDLDEIAKLISHGKFADARKRL